MRNRTFLSILILLTVLPLAFASCAPATPAAPAAATSVSASAPAAAASASPAASGTKKTLRIEADAWVIKKFPMQDAADRFMKDHPDIQVTVAEKSEENFAQKYLLDWSGGKTSVDLSVGGTEGQLAALAAKDLLVPWDEFLTGDTAKDKFVPAFINLGIYNGKRLTLPFMGEVIMFSVNKDIMKQAGLIDANGNPVAPKTLDDVYDYCKKMTKKEGDKTVQYGCSLHVGFSFATYNYLAALQSSAGTMFGADGKTVDLESKAALDWLALQQKLVKDGYGFTGTASDDDAGRNDYKAGKIGMILEAASRTVEGQTALGKDKAAVMPLPGSLEHGTVAYAHHVFIPKLSPNADLAKQFVREQMMQKWFSQWSWERFGKLPVLAASYEGLGTDAATILTAAQKSANAPLYRDYNQMDTMMQQEFQKNALGQQTPQQTLDNLKAQIKKLDLTNLVTGK